MKKKNVSFKLTVVIYILLVYIGKVMTELNYLQKNGNIDDDTAKKIQQYQQTKLFSIHWELRTILYLGIVLLTSGVGILIYLNIDTIGHQAILALIALACGGCFYYANKHKQPYKQEQVTYASPFFDYVVLFGSLLFGVFIGYLQYQYHALGSYYGVVTAIPTGLFFCTAYRFDHKGVLSLAIAGLATTFGLSVRPMNMLEYNDFSSLSLIVTAILLGTAMAVWAWYSDAKSIKKHFSFSYANFSANILFVAILAALFGQGLKPLSFLLLVLTCAYFIRYAILQKSFLFLLLAVLYGYIGLTYAVFSLLASAESLNEGIVVFGLFYIIVSCAGVVLFFINFKKILGIKK